MATRTQLTRIEKGYKPSVSFVFFINDVVEIQYVGNFAFQNSYKNYPSPSNTKLAIEKQIDSLLGRGGRINLVHIPATETDFLREKMKILHDLNPSYTNEDNDITYVSSGGDYVLTTKEISYISNWGKLNGLGYVALVFPNRTSSFMSGRVGMPEGKGVLADRKFTFMYAIYKIILVDTATNEVTDTARVYTYKQVPFFARELSNEEIDQITRRWENEEYEDNTVQVVEHNEQLLNKMLDDERYYKGEQYSNLKDQEIQNIDNDLKPILARNIKKQLLYLGFLEGKRPQFFNDRIESSADLK
jgi:hypothetical protein